MWQNRLGYVLPGNSVNSWGQREGRLRLKPSEQLCRLLALSSCLAMSLLLNSPDATWARMHGSFSCIRYHTLLDEPSCTGSAEGCATVGVSWQHHRLAVATNEDYSLTALQKCIRWIAAPAKAVVRRRGRRKTSGGVILAPFGQVATADILAKSTCATGSCLALLL